MNLNKEIITFFQLIVVVFLIFLVLDQISGRFLLPNLKIFLLIVVLLGVLIFSIDGSRKEQQKETQKIKIPFRVGVGVVSIISLVILIMETKNQIIFSIIAIIMIATTLLALNKDENYSLFIR